ncbi:MAG: amidohydrolase [Clostridia bacterium]|nr:amidohydrolase [Clostridia bacterium]
MKNLHSTLKELFEWLHQHPELGFAEYETTAKLRTILEHEGIEVLDTGLQTGLIAQITGDLPGRCVVLRCDIDALPIQEQTELPYASTHPGRMHACGHDAHTAIMLGAALMLNQRRPELTGSVKIVFQPAEELPAGARVVLATGMLEDADLFLGVHVSPELPAGTLGLKAGPVMAAVDRFAITIHGRGAHAAQPHEGVDPIVVQAAIVQSAQTIVSRALDPFAAAVVSITHVESGSTWNVLPETAFLEGTVRTLEPAVREKAEVLMRGFTTQIAASYGAQADFAWRPGPPAVINDPALCQAARYVAEDMHIPTAQQENTMTGEDFSCYLENRPGLFVRVGTGCSFPLHHPKFKVDQQILYPTAQYFAQLTEHLLNKGV